MLCSKHTELQLYMTSLLMHLKKKVTVCSGIHAHHINTMSTMWNFGMLKLVVVN